MKKDVRELFFHYFYLEPFKSDHRENEVHESFNKDPVAKLSSTEFLVFGPAKPEQSFRENFYP